MSGRAAAAFAELSIVKGWPHTVAALREWRTRPLQTLWPWVAVSFACAVTLLALTYAIASVSTPDPSGFGPRPANLKDAPGQFMLTVIQQNMLVLALHAAACFAGYITHVALPDAEGRDTGTLLRLNRLAGSIAMVFVPMATVFSIVTQSWVLGDRAAELSYHLHLPLWMVLASVLPHALPELCAVFLPLGAWLVAAWLRQWDELIAATIASIAIAFPIIVLSAAVEAHTWPDRVIELQLQYPSFEGAHVGSRKSTALGIICDDDSPFSGFDDPCSSISARREWLWLQGRTTTTTYATLDAAIADVRPATERGPASVIIQTRRGFDAYGLRSKLAQVGVGSGTGGEPVELSGLRGFLLSTTNLRGGTIVAVVDGPERLTWEQLAAQANPATTAGSHT